jgi:hypothetical protein
MCTLVKYSAQTHGNTEKSTLFISFPRPLITSLHSARHTRTNNTEYTASLHRGSPWILSLELSLGWVVLVCVDYTIPSCAVL